MPNHITNCLTITHDNQIEILRLKTCFTKEGNLDFNKIIPMPEEIKNTVSPTLIVDTKKEADEINSKQEDGKFKAMTRLKELRMIKKYGASNWYDWSIGRWGTKWNSYDGKIIEIDSNKIVCQFETAWSSPSGILAELKRQGFKINGLWKDEGDFEVHYIGDGGQWDVLTEFEYLGE